MPVFGLRILLQSRYRHFLCLLFFLISSLGIAFSQSPPSLTDSLKVLIKSTPKFTAGFQTRGSFIDGKTANVREISAGIVFKDRLTFGMGYHWLKSKGSHNRFFDNEWKMTQLKMRYYSFNVSYTFYQKNNWYISLPVEFGFGKSFRQADDGEQYGAQNILLYEPVMHAEYRLFKYFGVAAGIGFRLMIKNNQALPEQFHSPIYVAQLKIRFSDIYTDLMRK